MEPPVYTRDQRRKALLFALLGNLVPLALATADRFSAHPTVFFVGVVVAMLVPVGVVLVPSRSPVRLPLALLGLPALTCLQAHSGGVGSRYAVLLVMATIWFGTQARRAEMIGGIVTVAGCCFLPMLVFGAPAYPVDWYQAALLCVIASAVIGSLATISRETWRLTSALRSQAVLDQLTGVLNRRGWIETTERELARARRAGQAVGVVALDLDGLKVANDTMGHDEGDRLIRDFAHNLRETFRTEDTVARLGGDEFSLLLVGTSEAIMLEAVERLRTAVTGRCPFSAGVALSHGDESREDLQRRADLALYEAKRVGGGRSVVANAALPDRLPAG